MPRRLPIFAAACVVAVSFLSPSGNTAVLAQGPAAPAPDAYRSLRWRHIGPVGNRVTSVVGIPGDPNVYYIGAASGGVWKTVDGGAHWDPIFDAQSAQSIGALAIAPSDPSIVWAGTGEQCIRSHISLGDGIYKSTDAGRTWTRMGLEKTGRIGRIIVHPRDPDTVFACSIGHAYGPQPERGVFRTTDGGKTWERVLFVDEKSGCSDLEMDPSNPRVLFAGMWQFEIHTWGRESGGPSSGLYTSRDGGGTWKKITGSELPKLPHGKVSLAIARSNPNRLYALIETGDGVPLAGKDQESGKLWRSDDGGETWRLVSHDRNAGGRTHYYFHVYAAPDNDNEVYFLTAAFAKSIDAGQTIVPQQARSSPGGDNHDLWIDPTNPSRMAIANDGGVSLSITRSRTWTRINLPIAQMYHVTVDNEIPYNVLGNRQDGPSFKGPSYSRTAGFGGGGISRGMWHPISGGESGWAIPDPQDPKIIWASGTGSGGIGGSVDRFDERTGQFRRVEVWPDSPLGGPAADTKYRFNWTFPLHMSPHDRNTIYAGSQHVHRTTNGGQSWDVISPDLTLNDKSRMGFSGGLTGDNIGVEYAGTILAIAESPREKGVIWAGTNDGLVQVTRDGGKSWSNVTSAIPNLPPWGTVYNIEPSRHRDGGAYVVFDFHQVNNRDPFVYRTSDYGKTWKNLSGTVPKSVLSYAHAIKEDPVKPGLLYLGTENAIYVSWNDGDTWQPLQNNLPRAPVYWITVQEHFNDLVIATYGRGFWILDDITPLRQVSAEVMGAAAHLFEPRPAYRFRPIASAPASVTDDPITGENPQYGASINYWLGSAGLKPGTTTDVTILDAQGQTVRALRGPAASGLNRVHWDLRYDPSTEIKLRTSPLHASWLRVGAEGTRAYPGGSAGRLSLLAPPGTYTVKLTAGGRDYTQKLVVRKDPNSTGNEADIAAQFRLMQDVRANLNAVASMINDVELVRKQLTDVTALADGDAAAAQIRAASKGLDAKLIAFEEKLHQMKLTGTGQDGVRYPNMLLEKIMHLANDLEIGDFPPTNQQLEVHKMHTEQIAAHRGALAALFSTDVTAFNATLKERGLGMIVVPKRTTTTN
jgi:Sortilin, neurotensin receptor 3,